MPDDDEVSHLAVEGDWLSSLHHCVRGLLHHGRGREAGAAWGGGVGAGAGVRVGWSRGRMGGGREGLSALYYLLI